MNLYQDNLDYLKNHLNCQLIPSMVEILIKICSRCLESKYGITNYLYILELKGLGGFQKVPLDPYSKNTHLKFSKFKLINFHTLFSFHQI